MQPNLALFFVVMALFCAAAVALQEYILAVAEGCATLLLLGCYQWLSVRRRRALADYVQATSEMLQHTSDGEMPFPVALVKLNDNELVWYNRAFAELTHVRERMSAQSLSEVIPGLSADFLAAGKQEAAAELRFEGRRYRVSGTVMPDADPKSGVMLGMLYLLALTDLLLVRDEYIRSRPIVSIVLVDNYDELTNNMPDVSISALNAQLNSRISDWADSFGGMLRKLERNRFLLLFEAKDLARMADGKFSLLESVRSVTSPTGIPATVSIGIGKDGVDFREDYDFAALSIEMALSRGGDQAVIKDRYNFTFYGGRTKETERHTRVKSRVVAGSLSELIAQSSQVFIMGHRMADLDALGAAAGIRCLCRKRGKPAHIVIDLKNNMAGSLIAELRQNEDYEDVFISGQDALVEADPRSLLIVVDTNRPDQVESRELLESIPRVAVIDHHRRAADYIEQVVLNLHEPFASSASELVAELLQYAVDQKDITPLEAQALLAGIVLDTKNFTVRTGSRTFEAAAFLRRAGADTVEVKKLFQADLDATILKYQVIQAARLYRNEIAISAVDTPVPRAIASQASDELLNISGILASFVLYPGAEGEVMISARSIGSCNVQMVLEPLGGGGNAATAGAQIRGSTVRDVLRELVASIDKFYET